MKSHRPFSLQVLLLTVVLLLSAVLSLQAKVLPDSVLTRKETVWDRIFFPTEIGVSLVPGGDLDPGLFWRTSLEYRMHALGGWFFTIEYEDHSHTYQDKRIAGSNVSKGECTQYDILGGTGFRYPINDHWKLAWLLQMGLSSNHITNVRPNGNDDYLLDDVVTRVPASKATFFVEYYVEPAFGFFIDCGYTVRHKALPTEVTRRMGLVSVSVGCTWNLY